MCYLYTLNDKLQKAAMPVCTLNFNRTSTECSERFSCRNASTLWQTIFVKILLLIQQQHEFRLIFQYKMCSLSMLKEVGKVTAQPPKWCVSSPATIGTRNLLIGISSDGIHSHQPVDNCCWQSWQERCWMKEEEMRSKLTTIRFLDVILHPRKIRL